MVELKDLVGAKVIEGSGDSLLIVEKDGLRYQITSTGIKLTDGKVFYKIGDPHMEVKLLPEEPARYIVFLGN